MEYSVSISSDGFKLSIDENNCLIVDHETLKEYPLHPLWLRERARLDNLHDKNTDQNVNNQKNGFHCRMLQTEIGTQPLS